MWMGEEDNPIVRREKSKIRFNDHVRLARCLCSSVEEHDERVFSPTLKHPQIILRGETFSHGREMARGVFYAPRVHQRGTEDVGHAFVNWDGRLLYARDG